jgi:cysteine desulfurase
MRDQFDLLAMSAHKFYGPKGVGALYAKRGIKLAPLLHGGNQEWGMRSGTYNTPLIVGMGIAAEISINEIETRMMRAQEKRLELTEYFEKNKYGKFNFTDVDTSPYILSFTLFEGDAEDFLIRMKNEFVASTGSACTSSLIDDSHVLKSVSLSKNIIRISY